MGTNIHPVLNTPQGISVNLCLLVAKIIRAQHLWSEDYLWTSEILLPKFYLTAIYFFEFLQIEHNKNRGNVEFQSEYR